MNDIFFNTIPIPGTAKPPPSINLRCNFYQRRQISLHNSRLWLYSSITSRIYTIGFASYCYKTLQNSRLWVLNYCFLDPNLTSSSLEVQETKKFIKIRGNRGRYSCFKLVHFIVYKDQHFNKGKSPRKTETEEKKKSYLHISPKPISVQLNTENLLSWLAKSEQNVQTVKLD